jgi:hypothetical protein
MHRRLHRNGENPAGGAPTAFHLSCDKYQLYHFLTSSSASQANCMMAFGRDTGSRLWPRPPLVYGVEEIR